MPPKSSGKKRHSAQLDAVQSQDGAKKWAMVPASCCACCCRRAAPGVAWASTDESMTPMGDKCAECHGVHQNYFGYITWDRVCEAHENTGYARGTDST